MSCNYTGYRGDIMFEMMIGLFFVFCVFMFVAKLGIGIIKILFMVLCPILILIFLPILLVPAIVLLGGGLVVLAFFKLLF